MESKAYIIGRNGLEEIDTQTPVVEVGQIVQLVGYNYNRYAVSEIAKDRFDQLHYIVIDLDSHTYSTKDHIRPLSEQFGIGVYYDDVDPKFISETELALLRTQADENKRKEGEKKAQDKAEVIRLKAIGRERLEKIVPQDAKAVIVAFLKENDSDSQRDYFAYTTAKTVIIGFSTSTRNNFNEMRKCAKNFKGTEHLAEYDPKQEYRENYSGGCGYYLGTHPYSGWTIQKQCYFRDRTQVIEHFALVAGQEDGIAVAETKTETAPQTVTPITAEGVQLIDYSEKAIAVVGETKAIKDTLKALGGRFNIRLTVNDETVAGWIFPKTKQSEVAQAIGINSGCAVA